MDHTQGFKERTKVKIAESKCKEYLDAKNVDYREFGFDPYNNPIPTKEFYLLPGIIRSAPDFAIFKEDCYFLEVKGCKDVLRLKVNDMEHYGIWNKLRSLWFFIYSSIRNKYKIISYKRLNDITKHCKVEIYDNNITNKEYYKVELEKIYGKKR